MTDFDYDVRQKKNLAHQAQHRKRGSRSKKCSLPSDNMTKRQWKERCGDVMTFQLGSPMTWEVFKSLPFDIQKEYLESLISKYNVTATAVAGMFGCSAETVCRLANKPEINVKFPRGHRMTNEEADAFSRFVQGDPVVYTSLPETDSPEPEVVEEPAIEIPVINDVSDEVTDEPVQRQQIGMLMREFTLSFEGRFDPSCLYNSLASILTSGQPCRVTVRCEVL